MTDFADRIQILSRELSRGAIAAVLGITETEVANVRADPDAAIPPATPSPAAYMFHHDASGMDTFVGVDPEEQEVSGFRQQIDLSRASEVRLYVLQSGRDGGAFDIRADYFDALTDLAPTDEAVLDVDFRWGTGPSVTLEDPLDGNAMIVSDWTPLGPRAKTDAIWRIITLNGDGTGAAALRHISLQIR